MTRYMLSMVAVTFCLSLGCKGADKSNQSAADQGTTKTSTPKGSDVDPPTTTTATPPPPKPLVCGPGTVKDQARCVAVPFHKAERKGLANTIASLSSMTSALDGLEVVDEQIRFLEQFAKSDVFEAAAALNSELKTAKDWLGKVTAAAGDIRGVKKALQGGQKSLKELEAVLNNALSGASGMTLDQLKTRVRAQVEQVSSKLQGISSETFTQATAALGPYIAKISAYANLGCAALKIKSVESLEAACKKITETVGAADKLTASLKLDPGALVQDVQRFLENQLPADLLK